MHGERNQSRGEREAEEVKGRVEAGRVVGARGGATSAFIRGGAAVSEALHLTGTEDPSGEASKDTPTGHPGDGPRALRGVCFAPGVRLERKDRGLSSLCPCWRMHRCGQNNRAGRAEGGEER